MASLRVMQILGQPGLCDETLTSCFHPVPTEALGFTAASEACAAQQFS